MDDSGNLPDRITLFRIPLASCGTTADLRREIRITILHELGHFFGFGEGDLEDRDQVAAEPPIPAVPPP